MDIAATFAIELYDAPNSAWVDVKAWAQNNTLEIDMVLNSGGTLNLDLEDTASAPVGLTPLRSMRIRVKDSTNTYFGGNITDVDAQYDLTDATIVRYHIVAQDYSKLLDRFPVNNVYTDLHAGDIVKAIVSKIPGAEAIDVTHVETGPVIAKAAFPNLTTREAIDEVARVAMYKWYMSPAKELYFFDPKVGALHANWDLNAAAMFAGRFHLEAPTVTREISQYRNLQEVKGGSIVDDNYSYYPLLTSPGIAGTYEPGKTPIKDIVRSWNIGKPINTITKVMFCLSPTFDENTYKWDRKISSQPNGGAFYYKQGEPYLRLSEEGENYAGVVENIADYAPRKGEYFWIKYKSETSVSARIEKTDEWCNSEGLAIEDTIYEMSQIEGGSGIYKAVEINDNLKTTKECYERARALLIQHGKVPTIVTYGSLSWGDMYPGKYQELDLYGFNGKLCTCNEMNMRDIDGCMLKAEFQLVGSERFSGLAYFKGIAGGQTPRMQSTYAIRADEIIIDFTGFQETLEITDALTRTDVAHATAKAWGTARFNDGGIWG